MNVLRIIAQNTVKYLASLVDILISRGRIKARMSGRNKHCDGIAPASRPCGNLKVHKAVANAEAHALPPLLPQLHGAADFLGALFCTVLRLKKNCRGRQEGARCVKGSVALRRAFCKGALRLRACMFPSFSGQNCTLQAVHRADPNSSGAWLDNMVALRAEGKKA